MSPVKEPRFFAHEGGSSDITGIRGRAPRYTQWDQYLKLFEGVQNEKAIGEASPLYLYKPGVAENIKKYLPEVKLIAILRQPADRAYSHYVMLAGRGKESAKSFEEALERERDRIKEGWNEAFHYRNWGFYYRQLCRYYQIFDRSQIQVFLYDDLKKDPAKFIRELYRFIGVDPDFLPAQKVIHNKSGYPRAPKIHDLLSNKHLKQWLPFSLPSGLKAFFKRIKNRNLAYPPLSPQTRAELTAEYQEDIRQLAKLVEKDLSIWLKSDQIAVH